MDKLDYEAPVIHQGNDIWWGARHIRIGVDLEIEAVWKMTGLTIGIYGLTEAGSLFFSKVRKTDMIEIISTWVQQHRFAIGMQGVNDLNAKDAKDAKVAREVNPKGGIHKIKYEQLGLEGCFNCGKRQRCSLVRILATPGDLKLAICDEYEHE